MILLVDSSLLIIERLKEILSEVLDVNLIHHANSYTEANKVLEIVTPAVVLLDTYLPGNGSMALLQNIQEMNQGIKVMMLTNHVNIADETRYLLSGAHCIIDKYHDFEKIPVVMQRVISEALLQTKTIF
ncbi:MAG: response regulator [Sediminibacterium sp.]